MNRDRWISLIVVAGAIALTVWIARHTYWHEATISKPLRGDAARNPFYAVAHLTSTLGIPSSTIGSLHALPMGAVVLVDNLHDDLRHESIETLQAWVQSGGRLIIGGNTLATSEALQTWSGIKPSRGEADEPRAMTSVARVLQSEADCQPMTVNVHGRASGESLILCNGLRKGLISQRVPTWSLSNADGIQVLRVSIGRGELTVVGPIYILSNRSLPMKDHAQIFVAAADLKRGDRLEILSRTRAEPLPALLWRLAAPAIVFLSIAVGLLVWRHIPRFGPPIPVTPAARRSLAEQIRANARFAWRTQRLQSLRTATGRALDEAAQRQIPGYARMSPQQRAEALAASTGLDVTTITAALLSDKTGGVNEHRAAITLLEACRRILIGFEINQRPSV